MKIPKRCRVELHIVQTHHLKTQEPSAAAKFLTCALGTIAILTWIVITQYATQATHNDVRISDELTSVSNKPTGEEIRPENLLNLLVNNTTGSLSEASGETGGESVEAKDYDNRGVCGDLQFNDDSTLSQISFTLAPGPDDTNGDDWSFLGSEPSREYVLTGSEIVELEVGYQYRFLYQDEPEGFVLVKEIFASAQSDKETVEGVLLSLEELKETLTARGGSFASNPEIRWAIPGCEHRQRWVFPLSSRLQLHMLLQLLTCLYFSFWYFGLIHDFRELQLQNIKGPSCYYPVCILILVVCVIVLMCKLESCYDPDDDCCDSPFDCITPNRYILCCLVFSFNLLGFVLCNWVMRRVVGSLKLMYGRPGRLLID